jgi:glycosyltransferase involved in cell wall biosynthesis
MKVAHLMAGAPTGGAELFFERLCLAAHQSGDEILPVIRHDPARTARLTAGGLTPKTLRFGGPLDLTTRPNLRRILQAARPQIAIAWMNRAARFAPTGPWVLAGRLGGEYDLRYYRPCTDLIANTRNLAAWIAAQGWPPARIHHLPNFAPDLANAAPAILGIPPHARIILAAGRLHPNKAFDVLLRALPKIPDAHLALAGDGPERAALQSQAARENIVDRVHFLGWRTDTAALLAACDLFVCPSRHEPLGNVILEAFSARRPVIAAAAAGPTELIDSGRTGLLVPIDDPQALAEAITRLLNAPEEAARLAQAARSDYEAHHAPPIVLARWREGLARIIAERTHS